MNTERKRVALPQVIRKWSSPQAYIDHVVGNCLATGIRRRDKIIREIQIGRIMERNVTAPTELTGLESLDLKPQALKVAVSRTTSRKDSHGHRDIWCVPKAHRYVSIKRVRELTGAVDHGGITAEEVVELKQSLDDLHQVALELRRKAQVMFTDATAVRQVAYNAHCSVLDLT